MTDLRDRFRSLDALPVPDLWAEIGRRAELPAAPPATGSDPDARSGGRTPVRRRSLRRRPLLTLVWLLVGLAIIGGAILVAAALLPRPTTPRPSSPGAFTPTGSPHVDRVCCWTATRLSDGRVLVVGGGDGPAEVWDPRDGAWSPAGTLGTFRENHLAILLADGRVLIVGGDGDADAHRLPMSAEVWDPGTSAFTSAGALDPTVVELVSVRLLADGRVLVEEVRSDQERSAEIWDSATSTFGPAGSLGDPSDAPAGLLLLDGRTLVGSDDGRSLQVWDPTSHTFSPGGPAPEMDEGGPVLLTDGRVLVVTLVPDRPCPPESSHHFRQVPCVVPEHAVAQVWDPTTRTLASTSGPARSGLSATATVLDDGRVLVVWSNAADVFGPT